MVCAIYCSENIFCVASNSWTYAKEDVNHLFVSVQIIILKANKIIESHLSIALEIIV